LAAQAIVRCLLFIMLVSAAGRATSIATSALSLTSLQISPAAGNVVFTAPWTAQAFVEALNNAGEFDSTFQSDGITSASAVVRFANATAQADGAAITAGAAANASIMAGLAHASSVGRSGLANTFSIAGGAGPVNVALTALVSGSLDLSTEGLGFLSEGELIFALLLDGKVVLFDTASRFIGPNSSATEQLSGRLSDTLMLEYGRMYSLLVTLDARSQAVHTEVPEPAGELLVCMAAAVIAWLGRAV
jgi:hypothetical protein